MIVYEIGTGYTPIPAKIGAATEIVVEELTKALIKKGEKVFLIDISCSNRLPNNLPIIEVPIGKKFQSTDEQLGLMHKMKRIIYSIHLARLIKKILKKTKEGVVLHFHNQYNIFFFYKLVSKKLQQKCRVLYTNHSYIWHGDWNQIKGTIKKKYFQEVYGMKHADKVFVLNDNALNNISSFCGVSRKNLSLIDNGVNTSVYYPLCGEDKKSVFLKYGMEGKKCFVQVGSVCDRKNQLESVRLLAPYLKKDKNLFFLFAGGIIDSSYCQEILDWAKAEGLKEQVKYMGEIKPGSDLNEFYNLGEAMVFPSKAEGFSLVVIEAMAAGTPVIINDSLQFKLHNSCLCFKDEKEFNSLIDNEIINHIRREEISKDIRSTICNNYGWDKIASEYIGQESGKGE